MRVYWMHRLVRRFILSDMERSSVGWKNAFNIAVISLHEGVFEKEKVTTFLKQNSDLATSTIPESIPSDENPEGTENDNKLYSRAKDIRWQ